MLPMHRPIAKSAGRAVISLLTARRPRASGFRISCAAIDDGCCSHGQDGCLRGNRTRRVRKDRAVLVVGLI